MNSNQIEMEGALRLEGAFLESIVAAYMLSKGEKVIPRPRTGDKQHDVLIERYDGFILCECTGLSEIRREKVYRFYNDALELHDELLRKYEKGLVEAWFIAATHENAWTTHSREEIQNVKRTLHEKLGINVKIISSDKLLLEILNSGVLGIRFVRDRAYWAGPEDLAIRYNPSKKSFEYGRCDEELINSFNKTHFSLLPSFYWESYYRTIFEEAVKDKMELPLSVFTYYPEEGLKWRSLDDVVASYESYLSSFTRISVLEKGEDFILELYVSRRKNRYYTLYIFTLGEQKAFSEAAFVSSALISALKGRAYRLVEDFKRVGKIPKNEQVSIVIISATQYWSPQAWGVIPEIPTALKEEVRISEHVSGNELLKLLLNCGVLGFKFVDKNRVSLVGPGTPAVRMTLEGLAITGKPPKNI